jgi:hypothetical protein
MQSVPINTDVVSSNLDQGKVVKRQHMYVGISMVSVMDHEPRSLKTNVMVMDHDN